MEYIELLRRLKRVGSVYWYPDMTKEEARKLAATLGGRNLEEVIDDIESALLTHCRSIFRQSGGSDFASYEVEVFFCAEPRMYVLSRALIRGDETSDERYWVFERLSELREAVKRTLKNISAWLQGWAEDAEYYAEKEKGWVREAWAEEARALRSEAEGLEEAAERLEI